MIIIIAILMGLVMTLGDSCKHHVAQLQIQNQTLDVQILMNETSIFQGATGEYVSLQTVPFGDCYMALQLNG